MVRVLNVSKWAHENKSTHVSIDLLKHTVIVGLAHELSGFRLAFKRNGRQDLCSKQTKTTKIVQSW